MRRTQQAICFFAWQNVEWLGKGGRNGLQYIEPWPGLKDSDDDAQALVPTASPDYPEQYALHKSRDSSSRRKLSFR